MGRNKWTKEEIEFLKNNKDLPLDKLIKNIKHSKKTISNMKNRLGLHKNRDIIGLKQGHLIVLSKHSISEDKRIQYYNCLCTYCNKECIKPKYYFTQKRKAYITCGCQRFPTGAKSKNWEGIGEIHLTFFNKIKNTAKHRNLEFNITIEYIWELFLKQNRRCALSGQLLTFPKGYKERIEATASLDRIDSSKGYIEGNVQWLSKEVNFMKYTLTESRFIELCKLIYLFNKEN